MSSNPLIDALSQALGPGAVVTRPDALATYDSDASWIVARAPQVVALPSTPAQAATAVALAVAAGLPVVARGAGTGIAGGAVPVRGGLVLSTARLDQIETIEPRSRRATVQAGVVNGELNARLAPLGLQFAPDPSSQRASTIGGNLATNAGGPHCLKYGVTSNHVLAVELIRPDGALIWTGEGHLEGSWAGYDLTGLVVGSEGTFGPVTRAIVRLTPLPEAVRVVLALFPSVVAASAAVSKVIAAGYLPTSLEVMDHNAIRAVNGAYGLGLPEASGTTLLIIEVDGVEDGLDTTLEEILALCAEQGAFELRPARTAAEQARVWVARKSVAGAIGRLAPAYLLVDSVVPRTRLPLMMEHVERLRHEQQMEVCNVFHAGDGNLHPLILYDPRDHSQVERAHAIAEGVLELSIAQGGVVSGEHGIGVEKQAYLPLLFTPAELQLQATVACVFNPGEQFNPGKIFPVDRPPAQLAAQRRERLRGATTEDQGLRIKDQGPRTKDQGQGQGWPGVDASERETYAPVSAGALALTPDLQTIVGADYVAQGTAGPLVWPATLDELSRVMAHCHSAGVAVVPCGDQHPAPGHASAAPPREASAVPTVRISVRRLKQVLSYEPDDLTIGVEAGMSLAELQALVAANGQQVPLEVADATVTLGSLVATAADGPRRLGYGTIRDWALALTVVEPDGTIVRLGAQVVKNVTGYDLVKLYVGSRGTLGIIAAVSLKLFPAARASGCLAVAFAERAGAMAMLDELAASRLQPSAAEYVEGVILEGFTPQRACLILLAEGHPQAVKRQINDLKAMATRHGAASTELVGDATWAPLWRSLASASAPTAPAGAARIRMCVAPAELGAALEHIAALGAARGVQVAINARALSGVISLLAEGPAAGLRELFSALVERWGRAQLLAADPEVRAGLPIWGAAPPGLELMRTLKAAIDPDNRLSPGSFIV